ncbi:MAG: alpha/beta fold hydrolase, partial [Solirubrobacteraceae bacterium]
MKRIRTDDHRVAVLAAAGTALAAGAVLTQRRHLRAIASDPLNDRLKAPPRGFVTNATSADGTVLHIETFGDAEASATKPTFVLAHGWTEQLNYWTLVIERLVAHGHRVCAYDLRGHGSSDPSQSDYAIERFGEDLEAVLEAVCADGERAIVAGHSLGGMSIVAWAEHHDVSARASAAALLFTGVSALLTDSLLVPIAPLAAALSRTPVPRAMLAAPGGVPRFSTPLSSAMVRYTAFGPTATPAQIAFYERMLIACPADVRSLVAMAISDMDIDHALPRLTIPTLVMAGANDRLTPPVHAQRMADVLPS